MALKLPGAAPVTAPGQGQVMDHIQASQMAHAAASRAAVAKVFAKPAGGAPGAPPPVATNPTKAPSAPNPGAGSFKHIVMGLAKTKGMKAPTPQHVHSAIDALTNVGRFSPQIGAALKAHDGPLQGPGGDATMNDISTAMPAMNPGV